jgi:hypothetical protein
MSLNLNALQDLTEVPSVKQRKKADVVSKRSSLSEEQTELKKIPMGIHNLDIILGGGFNWT